MGLSGFDLVLVSVLIVIVAALYSSVGHGGASGYLAVLSFLAVSPPLLSTTALLLNVLVAGTGTVLFLRGGHFSWRLALPFVVLSVPASFVGGFLPVSDTAYFLLLAIVLLFASIRLATAGAVKEDQQPSVALSQPVAVGAGAGIGLLSGIVGVGGGIFLSPLMILMKWATPKQTAAVSAFFIVVNSLAGLAGRGMRGGLEIGTIWPLVGAAFAGGMLGSYAGSRIFSGILLRRILALVLLVAAVKLIL